MFPNHSLKVSYTYTLHVVSFPGGSAGKESICNAGDPGSFPGLGRCPEQGIGHLFQYSWASLVAQLVKNLPAMQKTWLQSLGQQDPLEEGMVTHSSSCLENPRDGGAWWAAVYGVAQSRTRLKRLSSSSMQPGGFPS